MSQWGSDTGTDPRGKGSIGWLVATVIAAIITLACGFAFGLGLMSVLGQFRQMAINPVTTWSDGGPQYFYGVFIGAFGGTFASMFYTAMGRKYRGGRRPYPFAFVFLALGATVGAQLGHYSIPPAGHVGESIDPTFNTVSSWGMGAWIMYYMPIWLPLLFLAAAGLAIYASIAAAFSSRKKTARANDLLQQGVKTTGQVIEAAFTGIRIHNQPVVRFTVAFTDQAGAPHRVTKTGTFNEAQMPRAGDYAVVWYDPEHPDDDKSVMVGLGPAASPAAPAQPQPVDSQPVDAQPWGSPPARPQTTYDNPGPGTQSGPIPGQWQPGEAGQNPPSSTSGSTLF